MENIDVLIKLQEKGDSMDDMYRMAWNHIVSAYKLIGWKGLYFLMLQFQRLIPSNYKFKHD